MGYNIHISSITPLFHNPLAAEDYVPAVGIYSYCSGSALAEPPFLYFDNKKAPVNAGAWVVPVFNFPYGDSKAMPFARSGIRRRVAQIQKGIRLRIPNQQHNP